MKEIDYKKIRDKIYDSSAIIASLASPFGASLYVAGLMSNNTDSVKTTLLQTGIGAVSLSVGYLIGRFVGETQSKDSSDLENKLS